MDYTNIIEELRAASLFDLYRLRAAIDQQLDHPERVEQARSRLRPGMRIKYFAEAENRLVEATVIELRRTRLLVENLLDGRRWLIPFYAVNIDAVDTDIKASAGQKGIDRSQLKVGDEVGYRDRQNRDTYGRVLALNPKTATVRTNGGETWRVAYRLLFPVIEGREAGASAPLEVKARLLED